MLVLTMSYGVLITKGKTDLETILVTQAVAYPVGIMAEVQEEIEVPPLVMEVTFHTVLA